MFDYRRVIFRHLNFKKCSETVSFLTFWLGHVLLATATCNFSTSELQKVLRECGALNMFTSKCTFRHSGVQFFDLGTSKSAPTPSFFLAFSLQNVLFATAVCNFSTSELQKVLRECGVLSIFTSKCPFRYSGVQFFDIRTSKSDPTPSVF